MSDTGLRAVYDRSASDWDRTRQSRFPERGWIELLLAALPPGSAVLDLGCGTGAPIAAAFLAAGHRLTGVDFAPGMLAIARGRYPQAEWIETDMRDLDLGRQFAALVAWDSFFHLTETEQRAMIPRFAAHLAPGGWLLFTTGPEAGTRWGQVSGGPVWHASLAPPDYALLLEASGLRLRRFVAEDPDCGGHTVWLVRKVSPPAG